MLLVSSMMLIGISSKRRRASLWGIAQILTEMNAPEWMLEDIRSHYEEKFPEHALDTDLRKYLAAVDEALRIYLGVFSYDTK